MMFVIFKKLRWYHRLWHTILTLLGKECYAFKLIETRPWLVELDRVWLCPGCWKYQSWSRGCADDHPELCDDCWAERQEEDKRCDPLSR
jgi:hypothetical protein